MNVKTIAGALAALCAPLLAPLSHQNHVRMRQFLTTKLVQVLLRTAPGEGPPRV